jgi:hypothetical protein
LTSPGDGSKSPAHILNLQPKQPIKPMTRTSIEACAKAFVLLLFLVFLYSAYKVADMIGWV